MKHMNDYQRFIALSRYARWIEEDNRRETWEETVTRLINYFSYHVDTNLGVKLDEEIWKKLKNNIVSLNIMPSMRSMMTAGPALSRENIAGYNCSYIPIDNPKAFDEVLIVYLQFQTGSLSIQKM